MKTITKKIETEWFDLILSGKKKFERRVADFEIEVGDILRLEEWAVIDNERKFTGRFIEKKVTYFQKHNLKEWIKKQPELLDFGYYTIQFD